MIAINISIQRQAAQHSDTEKTGTPGGCGLISQAETLFFLLPEDNDSWQESCLKIYPAAWNVPSALWKTAHHRTLTICVLLYWVLPSATKHKNIHSYTLELFGKSSEYLLLWHHQRLPVYSPVIRKPVCKNDCFGWRLLTHLMMI